MNDDFGSMYEADVAKPAALDGDRLSRLSALCKTLLETQHHAAELDALLIAAEGNIRKLSEELIPELLKECGLSEVKLADGTKVTVSPDLECAITEERRAEALRWLRDHNLGGIIKTELAVEFGKGDETAARALAILLRRGVSEDVRMKIVEHAHEEGAPAELVSALDDVLSRSLPVETAESVHWQTLKATLKAERAAGREVPAETFALRPFDRTKLTLPDGVPKPAAVRKRK